MSQWQPVSRGTDENEPTVVLGEEPTIEVRRLPEHTQVLDVSALQAAHEPPLQAPRGGDAEQEASPSEDDQEVGAHDDPAYALQLSRMQNRRLTDLGLFLLRLSSLALVLEGIHQLMHLGPAIEALRGVPFVGQAPDLVAVALGTAWVVFPALLAVGLFTRVAALLQAAGIAVVYACLLLGGAPVLDPLTGGLAQPAPLAYAALALPLVFTGAGRLSIDHALGADRRVRLAERRASRDRARHPR